VGLHACKSEHAIIKVCAPLPELECCTMPACKQDNRRQNSTVRGIMCTCLA
jgi:hypothetical protein